MLWRVRPGPTFAAWRFLQGSQAAVCKLRHQSQAMPLFLVAQSAVGVMGVAFFVAAFGVRDLLEGDVFDVGSGFKLGTPTLPSKLSASRRGLAKTMWC